MELIDKSLDDVCMVCGGANIDRGEQCSTCGDCGAEYDNTDYAAFFDAFNTLSAPARNAICENKAALRAEVFSPSPNAERIKELCNKVDEILPGDRYAEFCAATLDEKALEKYYDDFDPDKASYLVRDITSYAAEKNRAVRPAIKLIEKSEKLGISVPAETKITLLEHAEKLTARYRMKSSLSRASAAAADGLKRFFIAFGLGIKRFFIAIGHGLKTIFTAIGHGLATVFIALWSVIKRAPRATWEFVKRGFDNEPPSGTVCAVGAAVSLFFSVLYRCLKLFLPSNYAADTACKVMRIIAIAVSAAVGLYVIICILRRIARGHSMPEILSCVLFPIGLSLVTLPIMLNVAEPLASRITYAVLAAGTVIWSFVHYKICRARNDATETLAFLAFYLCDCSLAFIVG